MGMSEGFLLELEQESAPTRRVLERVPGDKLSWKPHEKSLSLGQLAFHVAGNPGFVAQMLQTDEMPMPDRSEIYPEAESAEAEPEAEAEGEPEAEPDPASHAGHAPVAAETLPRDQAAPEAPTPLTAASRK